MREVQPKEYAVYATWEGLTAKLRQLEREFPDLVVVESVGLTRQGRDIWMVTVTAKSTGPAEDKPAVYIDANHHAGEVAGSAVCLYAIAYLAHNYGAREDIKRLLETRTFYIRPRVSPDGSEMYLTTPYLLRSSPRPWPEDRVDGGIVPEDLDGDGSIRQMRFPDPSGEWRVSDRDPRLMVRRRPDEFGGEYYRVYTEGIIEGYDGAEIGIAQPKWGLDLNRNYPITWGGESRQPGAGPFPLSEPETRSVADFLDSHRNVGLVLAYHTAGGMILRPSTTQRDDELPQADLAMYHALGRRGTEITGYPVMPIFEGFTGGRRPLLGALSALAYDHFGMMYWSVELWDLGARAGIPFRRREERVSLSEDEEEDEALKIIQWVDREMGGEGFSAWTTVGHPQLGEVEVGGFDRKFIRQNPPLRLLHQECHKQLLFMLALASAAPRVEIEQTEVQDLGNGVLHIEAVVANSGYLPTSATERGRYSGCVRPVEVVLQPPEGAVLLSGKTVTGLGHLPGRGSATGSPFATLSVGGSRKKVSWVVDASGVKGQPVFEVTADGGRGGRARASVELRPE